MALGRPREAIPYLESEFRVHPGSTRALLRLGMSQEALGELPAALATYERLLARTPDHYSALVRAARLADRLGQHDRGRELRARARHVGPLLAGSTRRP